MNAEIVAIIAALLSLGLCVGIMVVSRRMKFDLNAPTFAVLLVIPLCVYMLASGRLTELSAPGGWQLKFKKVISEVVDTAQLVPVVPIEVRAMHLPLPDTVLIHSPNCLRISLNDNYNYGFLCDYLKYVKNTFATGQVKYLVLVTGTNQFDSMIPIGSITANSELTTPRGECNATELISWIRDNNVKKLSGLKGYAGIDQAASLRSSKQSCLHAMYEMGLETLPVINRKGEIIGFIERNQLVAEILVDVTKRLGE